MSPTSPAIFRREKLEKFSKPENYLGLPLLLPAAVGSYLLEYPLLAMSLLYCSVASVYLLDAATKLYVDTEERKRKIFGNQFLEITARFEPLDQLGIPRSVDELTEKIGADGFFTGILSLASRNGHFDKFMRELGDAEGWSKEYEESLNQFRKTYEYHTENRQEVGK